MFKIIFSVALLAGFLSGVGISLVQEFTTTPLILHAEEFENADIQAHAGEARESKNATEWEPVNRLERFAYTALANIVVGVGFALLLVASFVLYGGDVRGRSGVIWGIAGFAIFTLSPGLGLPPELPGSFAAELSARQGWWLAAALSAAMGLWLMIFRDGWIFNGAGLLIMVLPHIIGAPHPPDFGGLVPAELAGQFTAASMVSMAIFWVMLGWLSGTFYQRFSAEIETET